MQDHHSAGQQKSSRKWWKLGMGAVVVVALGIWVNPIFFLIGPMIFMHLFGHGGEHHSETGLVQAKTTTRMENRTRTNIQQVVIE